MSPAAAALLPFIPLPNLPGDAQNFHFVTTNSDRENDVNVRFNHSFGPITGQRGRLPRGGGFGGGRGGRQGGRAISFGLQYRTQDIALSNSLPATGGKSTLGGMHISLPLNPTIG